MPTLLANCPPDNERGSTKHGQIGKVLDKLLIRALDFTVPTMPTLRPKLRHGGNAGSFLDGDGLRLK